MYNFRDGHDTHVSMHSPFGTELLNSLEMAGSPLPDLPDDLKHKQDFRKTSPVPPTEPRGPPTRAHTRGVTVPTEHSNVYGE